eukprot:2152710-Rhodomonas_salina.1
MEAGRISGEREAELDDDTMTALLHARCVAEPASGPVVLDSHALSGSAQHPTVGMVSREREIARSKPKSRGWMSRGWWSRGWVVTWVGGHVGGHVGR